MFLSVVIPAYNEEQYLPVCLRALRQQTFPADRFELVVWTSSRRAQECNWQMARRGLANVVKCFLLRRAPLPMPDIRQGIAGMNKDPRGIGTG